MFRVKVSRRLNALTGGRSNQTISSRIHEENLYGWRLAIDWWFYILRGEKNHCRHTHSWERWIGRRRK